VEVQAESRNNDNNTAIALRGSSKNRDM